MKLNEYQIRAYETAQYGYGQAIVYPLMGLAGEAGEVMNKLKKVFRDSDGEFTEERKDGIIDELGDTLWYIAATCTDLGITLEELAQRNLDKLKDRNQRGVVKGDRDNR